MAPKPCTIEAIYSTSINYKVCEIEEEFDIRWEDIKDYTVRWGRLQLTMKCGKTFEYDRFEERGEICWKRPYELNELNEDFERLEDLAPTTNKE